MALHKLGVLLSSPAGDYFDFAEFFDLVETCFFINEFNAIPECRKASNTSNCVLYPLRTTDGHYTFAYVVYVICECTEDVKITIPLNHAISHYDLTFVMNQSIDIQVNKFIMNTDDMLFVTITPSQTQMFVGCLGFIVYNAANINSCVKVPIHLYLHCHVQREIVYFHLMYPDTEPIPNVAFLSAQPVALFCGPKIGYKLIDNTSWTLQTNLTWICPGTTFCNLDIFLSTLPQFIVCGGLLCKCHVNLSIQETDLKNTESSSSGFTTNEKEKVHYNTFIKLVHVGCLCSPVNLVLQNTLDTDVYIPNGLTFTLTLIPANSKHEVVTFPQSFCPGNCCNFEDCILSYHGN